MRQIDCSRRPAEGRARWCYPAAAPRRGDPRGVSDVLTFGQTGGVRCPLRYVITWKTWEKNNTPRFTVVQNGKGHMVGSRAVQTHHLRGHTRPRLASRLGVPTRGAVTEPGRRQRCVHATRHLLSRFSGASTLNDTLLPGWPGTSYPWNCGVRTTLESSRANQNLIHKTQQCHL